MHFWSCLSIRIILILEMSEMRLKVGVGEVVLKLSLSMNNIVETHLSRKGKL